MSQLKLEAEEDPLKEMSKYFGIRGLLEELHQGK